MHAQKLKAVITILPVYHENVGLTYFRKIIPNEANDLVECFDQTHVNGSYRRIGKEDKIKY